MAHEDLSRVQQVESSSDRSFGLVFAAVFAIIACWPLIYQELPRWWALGIALALTAIAIWKPALLARPNRLWVRFGLLLGRIVSPIAMGILFYGVLTPVALIVRLTGKDPLRLKFESGTDSYWILRQPPGPPPDSMTNQF